MSSKIIMVSCQGDRLEIEGNLCIHIRLIREMIENLGLDISNMSESLEVPLGNVVDTKTMNLVKVKLLRRSEYSPPFSGLYRRFCPESTFSAEDIQCSGRPTNRRDGD